MPHYLFVDEEESERQSFSKLLTTDDLTIEPMAPKPNLSFLSNRLAEPRVDGVLLDFMLRAGDISIPYKGSTLAASIKEERSDVPIVVLSGVLAQHEASYRRTEQLYDWTLDKAKVAEDAVSARRQLVTLAEGYKAIVERFRDVDDKDKVTVVVQLLDLNHDLDGVAYWLAGESQGDPSRLARLIIHTLLALPGPLLESRRAAVALGVDPKALDRVAPAMETAKYSGVFSDLYDDPRYWTPRLGDCSIPEDAAPAQCEVCGEKASVICEVCHRCYDGFHSLGVARLGAPAKFGGGRVCGYCLESPLPDHLQVPVESKDLIATVIVEAKSAGRSHRVREG